MTAPALITPSRFDRLGIAASSACAVHCVLTPVIVAFFPAITNFLPGGEVIHRILAIVIVSMGAMAFLSGYRIHRRKRVLFLMATGMALVLTTATWGEYISSWMVEAGITLLGSTLLITAHVLNRSFCRNCGLCESQRVG